MAFEGNCNENLGVTGTSKVCVSWSSIFGFWRAKPGFEFATEADAQDLDKVYQAIQDELLYPFPPIFAQEVEDEDTVNEEGSLGIVPIRKGKKSWKFMIATNPYQDAIFQTHDNAAGGIFYISTIGGIRGVTDGVKLKPIEYQLFQVQKPTENNGTDAGNKTNIKVVVADIDAYINDVAIVEASDLTWDAKAVEGLYPVELTVQSSSATSIVLAATIAGTTIPVEGLDVTPSADFIIKDASGVEIVPTLISEEVGTGKYTFTATGLVTGDTVNLVDPSTMATSLITAGVGYKSNGARELTV